MFRWVLQFFERGDRCRVPDETVALDEVASARMCDSELERQAELAEAVQAKAAFGAMLTDDINDRESYEKLRDDALEILGMIDERFYASFARHQIIRLCRAAGEMDRSAELLAKVTDEFILDEIYDEFPDLEPDRIGAAGSAEPLHP